MTLFTWFSSICSNVTANDVQLSHETHEIGHYNNAHVTDFSFRSIEGQPISLKDYHGKAILIVNTASRCGFTDQYAGLQALWEEYQDRGLVVLAVPSNDFGGQEPLEGVDIKKFCKTHYGVNFPIMEKTIVRGERAHPFYRFVSRKLGFSGSPKWNFHKYLINADGELVDWFSSITKPNSPKLRLAIENALPAIAQPPMTSVASDITTQATPVSAVLADPEAIIPVQNDSQ